MLRPVRLRCACHGRTERLTIRCASAAATDDKGPLFLSRFYTVKVLKLPLLMGENGSTLWPPRNRLLKIDSSLLWPPTRLSEHVYNRSCRRAARQRIWRVESSGQRHAKGG